MQQKFTSVLCKTQNVQQLKKNYTNSETFVIMASETTSPLYLDIVTFVATLFVSLNTLLRYPYIGGVITVSISSDIDVMTNLSLVIFSTCFVNGVAWSLFHPSILTIFWVQTFPADGGVAGVRVNTRC